MYGYGYRYNSGLVVGAGGGAPFINTYSLDFDGINDYLNLGDSDDFSFGDGATDSPFSISAWIKMDSTSGFRIFNKSLGATSEYQFATSGSGKLQLFIFNSTSNFIYRARVYNTVLNTGQWYHVAATYNGVGGSNAQDGIKIYVDGVRVDDSSVSGGTYVAMGNTTAPVYIGKLDSSYANGSIDEVSVFDTAIDITDVWDGSGKPTDLSDLSPIAWYRMGDNGSYKSPQWLIPNNSNKDKVSNYTFQLDGINDYIDVGTSLNLGTDSTISMWIKRGRVSTTEMLLGEDTYSFDLTSYISASNTLIFKVGTFDSTFNAFPIANTLNDTTNWIHICWVRSGDSVELFLNGVSMQTKTGFGAVTNTRFDTIAAKPTGALTFMGNIDEVAAWDTNTINPIDIYNGGEPTILPSGAVAHWKMGENATLLTDWTIPDEVGSNDGASVNMNFLDRIGEAPNSTGNALSFNMDSGDRLEDTP